MKLYIQFSFVMLMLITNICFDSTAQNRIVLMSGDTLNCSIYKENKDYLFFRQNYQGVASKGKIAKNEVIQWTYQGVNPNQKLQVEPMLEQSERSMEADPLNNPDKRRWENPFRVSLTGGPALLLGSTDKAIENLENKGVPQELAENYYSDLISGYSGKASIYYRISKDYWLGALYNGFYSDAEELTKIDFDDVNWYYGEMGERIFVNFTGISLFSSSTFGRKKRLAFHSFYSLGPVFYHNRVKQLNQQILIKGTSLGQNLDFGLEYFIKSRWSVGLDASLFLSILKNITVSTLSSSQKIELEKDNYENLSQLNFSYSLAFYW